MEMEIIRQNRSLPQQDSEGYVSTLYNCLTDMAQFLCFYDIAIKLKTNTNYDIGGTYSEDEPDFWFYYTTSMCHGFNFLINLFVLPRKPGSFTLLLPKTNQLSDVARASDVKQVLIQSSQTPMTFRTTQKDEHVYIKTFRFDLDDLGTLDKSVLLMPFSIQLHSKLQLDQNTVKTLKLRHDFSNLRFQTETADFTLESNTGTKYLVHKVLIAAHCPVLRHYLNNPEKKLALEISDDAMNIILEFLYTGTLKNLYQFDHMILLDIAEKLEFNQLFALAQQILGDDITVDNAIHVARLAKKYNLDKLTYTVFEYIKEHPDVLKTETWHSLDDIDLVKQMLKHLHPPAVEDI